LYIVRGGEGRKKKHVQLSKFLQGEGEREKKTGPTPRIELAEDKRKLGQRGSFRCTEFSTLWNARKWGGGPLLPTVILSA